MKLKFLLLAKKLCSSSTHHSHQMGCVIAKKNRVVSLGFNQLKTHRKSLHDFNYIHAEFHAMLGCSPDELKGATAYIYREHKNGNTALARPCSSCERMLREAGIKKVCYTTSGMPQEEYL